MKSLFSLSVEVVGDDVDDEAEAASSQDNSEPPEKKMRRSLDVSSLQDVRLTYLKAEHEEKMKVVRKECELLSERRKCVEMECELILERRKYAEIEHKARMEQIKNSN